jgi:hypothetical protein
VTVDGAPAEVDAVSVSRELASSLPGTVIGGSGLTAATGRATWSQQDAVETRSVTPWAPASGIPPAGGARVLVDLGDERGTCRLLTGRVDSSTGSLGDAVVRSELVDDVDRLHRPVTIGPLLSSMPPLTPGGPPRQVRMNGLWVADAVLRACGFYATPPAGAGTMLSVSAMGSMWPERGTCTACTNYAGTDFPQFVSAPWGGVAAQDVVAAYQPAAAGRTLDSPLEVLMYWPGSTAGTPEVRVFFGGASVRLILTSGSVIAQTITSAHTPTNVALASRGTATRAVARFTPNGANIDVEVRTNTGATASGTVAAPAGLLSTALSEVTIRSGNASGRVGPVKVAFIAAGSAFADLTTFTPSAVFDVGSVALYTLTALPSIINRNALNILKDHAAAVGAALWLDEQGRVRWVARDRLGVGNPVRTLTSRDDLLDATWSAEWRDVASRVDVEWQQPAVTRATRDKVTVWEGSGGGLDAGDVYEEIIRPSAGEEWIMLDTSVTGLGAGSDLALFNAGEGSFEGASMVDESTDTESWAPAATSDTTVRQIDPRTYVVTTTVASVPSGHSVSAKAPSVPGIGVHTARFGDPLPVIRARARFELTPTTTTSATTGPPEAAVLTHDAGWWVQFEDQARALADWIASTTTIRTPHLHDVEVMFDPRLQLGDVVQIDDPERSGLSVRGVVFGMTQRVAPAEAATVLTVRVLSVTILNPTLGEYDAAWSGATLGERDALWSGSTLATFDANPTRRS